MTAALGAITVARVVLGSHPLGPRDVLRRRPLLQGLVLFQGHPEEALDAVGTDFHKVLRVKIEQIFGLDPCLFSRHGDPRKASSGQ